VKLTNITCGRFSDSSDSKMTANAMVICEIKLLQWFISHVATSDIISQLS